MTSLKVSFFLRNIFRGNLNETISLTEIEVIFEVTSILTNFRARSLVVSDLRSDTKGSRFESSYKLWKR